MPIHGYGPEQMPERSVWKHSSQLAPYLVFQNRSLSLIDFLPFGFSCLLVKTKYTTLFIYFSLFTAQRWFFLLFFGFLLWSTKWTLENKCNGYWIWVIALKSDPGWRSQVQTLRVTLVVCVWGKGRRKKEIFLCGWWVSEINSCEVEGSRAYFRPTQFLCII